jgi:hypothetical protein
MAEIRSVTAAVHVAPIMADLCIHHSARHAELMLGRAEKLALKPEFSLRARSRDLADEE